MRRIHLCLLVAGAILIPSTTAWAKDVRETAQASAPSKPDTSKMTEARTHYERGLQLYDEGQYDGARVEFERAYELAPTYRILYNIGLVQKQQGDFVGALRNFQSYLEEGGNLVPEVRMTEVTKEIGALRARIGTVTITTSVPDADVFIDDVPVGKSPLPKPLLVNPGRRKISATKAGRLPANAVVEIASSDAKTVELELAESSTLVVVEKRRRVPWVGWIATGALAVGAGITGYIAIDGASKLDDMKDSPNPNEDELSSQSTKVKALSIVADVCTVAAVVVGGVSLYYTIKWGKEDSESKEASAPNTASGGWLKISPRAMMDPTRGGITGAGIGAVGAF